MGTQTQASTQDILTKTLAILVSQLVRFFLQSIIFTEKLLCTSKVPKMYILSSHINDEFH